MEKDFKKIKYSVGLYIRITPEMRKFIDEKEYSPSMIFRDAIKRLGFRK